MISNGRLLQELRLVQSTALLKYMHTQVTMHMMPSGILHHQSAPCKLARYCPFGGYSLSLAEFNPSASPQASDNPTAEVQAALFVGEARLVVRKGAVWVNG